MDTPQFKEAVACFLDSADRLDFDKGDVILEVAGEYITVSTETRRGQLYVRENGQTYIAEDWIINRLATVQMLADRILSAVPETLSFVTPQAEFLDDLIRAPQDKILHTTDAVEAVREFLDRRPGGTCSVLYITSDAGEGKTTLINRLAREQAARYKAKTTDWLLVPIGLGGRPFLRFDDVVVASLVNQLRFQRLYFDAFMHLVRMGVLVPALDGFEEIFVENASGDAISSLGSLIRQLKGEGSMLIAARKAYFEFRRLETQAKLLDSLPDSDVAFGRVALCRWSREEFLDYCKKTSLLIGADVYAEVSAVLSPDHPLLTRPVLVRRLVEIAKNKGMRFVKELRPQANNYFEWLVNQLLEREASEKWIDKHGDTPKPLLTVEEHHELLGYIAEEMWTTKAGLLSGEMIESLAEIFCDSKNLSPVAARQIKERVKQHALIVSTSFGREYSFDHDDFREFFLGEQLALHLLAGSESDIRRIFRADNLPELTVDIAVYKLIFEENDSAPIIELMLKVGASEGFSSFVRENAGALIAPLLSCKHSSVVELDGLVFPPDALRARGIVSNVLFQNCYFRPTSLSGSAISDCIFRGCEFEVLNLNENDAITNCFMINTRIHSVSVCKSSDVTDYYAPEEIYTQVTRSGFSVESESISIETDVIRDVDPDLRIVEKALQTFQRSTYVAEGTFRLRLSIHATHFIDELLPLLVRTGIIEEFQQGGVNKYRRNIPFSTIAKALADSGGSLDRFLGAAKTLAPFGR